MNDTLKFIPVKPDHMKEKENILKIQLIFNRLFYSAKCKENPVDQSKHVQ